MENRMRRDAEGAETAAAAVAGITDHASFVVSEREARDRKSSLFQGSRVASLIASFAAAKLHLFAAEAARTA